MFKNTMISERRNMQFRVEATNVLNHTNFDAIGTAFAFNPIHFGQVISARGPRIVQLGLKLLFWHSHSTRLEVSDIIMAV